MKVILYMSTTINGLIATEEDNTDFVSEIEWKNFMDIIKKVGNMIIGKRTYEIMYKNNEFSKMDRIKIFVLTHKLIKSNNPNLIFTSQTPKEVLNTIKGLGYKEALVCGGGKLNSSFMKENLIDEIYLDIEPKAIGKGICLFANSNFNIDLELIDFTQLSKNEIQLHYKII